MAEEKKTTIEKVHPLGIRKASMTGETHFITSRCTVLATTYRDGPGKVSVVGANLVGMTPEEAFRVGAAISEASRLTRGDKDPYVLDYATSSSDGSTQAVIIETEEIPAPEVKPAPTAPPPSVPIDNAK